MELKVNETAKHGRVKETTKKSSFLYLYDVLGNAVVSSTNFVEHYLNIQIYERLVHKAKDERNKEPRSFVYEDARTISSSSITTMWTRHTSAVSNLCICVLWCKRFSLGLYCVNAFSKTKYLFDGLCIDVQVKQQILFQMKLLSFLHTVENFGFAMNVSD